MGGGRGALAPSAPPSYAYGYVHACVMLIQYVLYNNGCNFCYTGTGFLPSQVVSPPLPVPSSLVNLVPSHYSSLPSSLVTAYTSSHGQILPRPLVPPPPCLQAFGPVGSSLRGLAEAPMGSQRPQSSTAPALHPDPLTFTPPLPISSICPPQAVPIGIPGLISGNTIPLLPMHMHGPRPPGPPPGIAYSFPGISSWTDDPACQKPYFPITVFNRTSSNPLTTCPPPPLALSSSLNPTPQWGPRTMPQHCPPVISMGYEQLLSAAQTSTQHSRSQQQRSRVTPNRAPAEGMRRYSASNTTSGEESETISISTPPRVESPDLHEDNGACKSGKVAAEVTPQSITLRGSEDETFEGSLDYSRVKRTRRDFRNSSSDSDSGGSCSSGQGGRRRNKLRRTVVSASCSTSSKSNNKKYQSKRSGNYEIEGRCNPLLQVVGEAETMDSEKAFVVRVTSNCHISTGVGVEADHEPSNDKETVPVCPTSDTRHEEEEEEHVEEGVMIPEPYLLNRGHGDKDRMHCPSGWLDDIVERSIANFKSKFPELNFSTDGKSSPPKITQNALCSVVL